LSAVVAIVAIVVVIVITVRVVAVVPAAAIIGIEAGKAVEQKNPRVR
jgi:hypothetical protein